MCDLVRLNGCRATQPSEIELRMTKVLLMFVFENLASSCMSVVKFFIIKENKYKLKVDPWCKPTLIGNSDVASYIILTLVTSPLYMSCMSLI